MTYNINMGINNNFNQINNFNNINGNLFINQNERISYDDRNRPGFQKMNVIFRSTHGEIITLLLNPNRTVDEMLTIYLKTINKPELIGQRYNPKFVFNAEFLYFGDKRLICQYFQKYSNPSVTVIWR